jgi:hypothetical protein
MRSTRMVPLRKASAAWAMLSTSVSARPNSRSVVSPCSRSRK